jgi:hypothetical protein
MQLSQILIELPVPLVADSLGASVEQRYRSVLPWLASLGLKTSAPLATVERMILGAQTRIPLSQKFTGRRFLSDWNFEFCLDPVSQDFTEEAVITEGTTNLLDEEFAMPESAMEFSTLSAPLTIESTLTQLPQPEVTQPEPIQPKLRQSRSAKPRRRASQFEQQSQQQSQLKNESANLPSQTERLQPQNHSQPGKQKGNQYTVISTHDDLGQQIDSNDTRLFYAIDETEYQIEDTFQLVNEVNSAVNSESRQEQELVEPVIKDSNSTRLIKKNSGQKNQQNLESRKEAKPKQKRYNNQLKNQTTENLEPINGIVKELALNTAEASFANNVVKNSSQESRNIKNHNNQNVEIESDTLSHIIQNRKPKQDEGKLPEKISLRSKVVNRSSDVEPANDFLTDTTLTKQTQQITQIAVPRNEKNLQPSPVLQRFKLATQSSILQGFSIGGQVTSRTPTKPIDASDTVPAMLTPGEFIINAIDAQKHLPLLHHINQGGSLSVVSDQIPTAEISKAKADSNHRICLSTSLQQQVSSESTTYVSLANNTLQANVSEENKSDQSELNQSVSTYQYPELIFHSQNLSYTSPNLSSRVLPPEWNSIEGLLQISSNDRAHSDFINGSDAAAHHLPNSKLHTLTTSETILNSLQKSSPLQPSIESVEQESTSNINELKNTKTLKTVLETLAQEIYIRLQQRFTIERERQGIYSGRLPW